MAPMVAMLKRVPPTPTAIKAIPLNRIAVWDVDGLSQLTDPLVQGNGLKEWIVAVNVISTMPYKNNYKTQILSRGIEKSRRNKKKKKKERVHHGLFLN